MINFGNNILTKNSEVGDFKFFKMKKIFFTIQNPS